MLGEIKKLTLIMQNLESKVSTGLDSLNARVTLIDGRLRVVEHHQRAMGFTNTNNKENNNTDLRKLMLQKPPTSDHKVIHECVN